VPRSRSRKPRRPSDPGLLASTAVNLSIRYAGPYQARPRKSGVARFQPRPWRNWATGVRDLGVFSALPPRHHGLSQERNEFTASVCDSAPSHPRSDGTARPRWGWKYASFPGRCRRRTAPGCSSDPQPVRRRSATNSGGPRRKQFRTGLGITADDHAEIGGLQEVVDERSHTFVPASAHQRKKDRTHASNRRDPAMRPLRSVVLGEPRQVAHDQGVRRECPRTPRGGDRTSTREGAAGGA
jgi:hypothetical protein